MDTIPKKTGRMLISIAIFTIQTCNTLGQNCLDLTQIFFLALSDNLFYIARL